MSLLLDVDDIERLFRQGVAKASIISNAESLLQRRSALMEGLASSLRLPSTPVLNLSDADNGPNSSAPVGDGVFLRLMTLPKGRGLLARMLRRLFSPFESSGAPSSSSQLRILCAVMRNLRSLFGFFPPEDQIVTVAKVSRENSAVSNQLSRSAAMQTTADIAAAGTF